MAFYSDDLIDEVLSQNDIVDVISSYVSLSKRGRNYVGLCPFHREKSPSFYVSIDKQIFKCFGCNEGGNVIHFIMKHENMDFKEAIEFLAKRAHIDLTKYTIETGSSKIDRNDKETVLNINRETAKFYHKNLIEKIKDENDILSIYLKKRKLDLNAVKKFGLGYADGKTRLDEYLISLGFKMEDILKAGNILKSENGRYYDRFFTRLIFPIFDIKDNVIAFGGRVLDDKMPKYLNSKETITYVKNRNLYLLNYARKEKLDYILIVEGYMDAVSLQKNGLTNVVASLGTALTENQAMLIKKYTNKVVVAYDSDAAGQEATLRSLDILTSKDLKVKVLKLDDENIKDPDEYINKKGTEKLKECIKNSLTLVDFKIQTLEKKLDINDLEQKLEFLNSVSNILSKIDNNIEREIYIDNISKKYMIAKTSIEKEIEKYIDKNVKKDEVIVVQNNKIPIARNNKKSKEEQVISLLLMKNKKVIDKIFDNILEEDFEIENLKKIFITLKTINKENDISKIDPLVKITNETLINNITNLIYVEVSNVDKMLSEVLKYFMLNRLSKRKDEILDLIQNKIKDKDEIEILETEFRQIIETVKNIKEKEV